ncbi:MAG: hypothetical protein HYY06_28685 [Deltaproteobacteria bacterium]|nr:hypothetical protein [Deltaproteobacteria bacterium]
MLPGRPFAVLFGVAMVACGSEPRTSGRALGRGMGEHSAPSARPAGAEDGAPEPALARDPDASRPPVSTEAAEPSTPERQPSDPWSSFSRAAGAVLGSNRGAVVRVAHLGDSHTASDALTGRLRRLLQDGLGDAGHGFVVPGWEASRLHRGIRLLASGGWTVDRVKYLPALDVGDRLFGLGAASVRSAAAGESFQVLARASVFDLYYLGAPGGGSFELRVDDGPAERVSTKADSSGAKFHRVEVPDGEHRLGVELVGDGEVRFFGVEIERPGPGIVYSSLGVGGARVTTPLEWDEDLFARQLERMRPDLVVMMYGTNDMYADDFSTPGFVANLERLVARIHAAVPAASCLVLAPPDVARRAQSGQLASIPELIGLVEAERAAAARAGCAFWDTLADMGGPGSIIEWHRQRPRLAARDHVHLTALGYERLAAPIAAELLRRASR